MLQDLVTVINSIIFSLQCLNISLILQESSDTTCTSWFFSLSHCFNTLISWQEERGYFTPPWNRTRTSAVGVWCHNHHATNYCCVWSFAVDLIPLPQSSTHPAHIPLPCPWTRHFPLPYLAWDLAESIYMIPGVRSSPSFFLCFLAV